MKSLFRMTLALVIAGTLVAPAVAQTAGPRGGGQNQAANQQARQQRLEQLQQIRKRVLDQLNLTADQRQKIDALMKKHEQEMQKLRDSLRQSVAGQSGQRNRAGARQGGADTGARQETMAKLRELQQQFQTDLQKILSSEQYTRFQQLMRQEMQRLRERMGRPGNANPPGGQRQRGQGTPPRP